MKQTVNGWLLVRVKRDEKTKGGLYVPGTYNDRILEAEVVLGCEAYENRPEVLPGTRILFDGIGGTHEVEVGDEKLDLVQVNNVMGFL